ncbi:oligosaccharide flippase family protein [candidate division KSB1 bacterium]|nr:oligosaccharide flippase family protein [candidate division KSB1 bacterium]
MIQHFKKLSKHTIVYGLGDIINKAIAFLLIPLHTHNLKTGEYGEYALIYAIETALPIVLSFGFHASILKVFYDYDSEEQRKETIATTIYFIFLTALPITLLLVFNAQYLSRLIGFEGTLDYPFYLRLTFGTAFFSLFRQITLAVLRAYERSIIYTLINIVNFTTLIILNFIFVGLLQKKADGIIQSSFLTSVFIFVLLLIAVLPKLKPALSKEKLKKLFDFGLPLVPGGLATWALTLFDRFLLNEMIGPEQVGLYEIGHKFGMMVNMILVQPFRTAWLPFVFSIQKEKEAKQICSKTLTYYFALGLFLCLGLAVMARELILLTTAHQYLEAYRVISLVALSYFFFGIYYIVDVGILIEGKTGVYAIVAWMGSMLNIGLAFILIPAFGMIGAGWAKLIAFLLLAVSMYFIAQRYYPIKYEIRRLIHLIITVAILYTGSFLLNFQSIYLSIIIKLILISLFPVLLYVSHFLTDREKEIALNFIKKRFKLGSSSL